MQKQLLITQVKGRLTEKGIRFLPGRETDLYLRGEFADAGKGAAARKICYEAAVYFDEPAKTIYMWDAASVIESVPSFPEGTPAPPKYSATLYRNVKHIRYGSDGAESEDMFNLSLIPMIIKDAARKYGWKFKIVVSKDQSMYPTAVHPMNHSKALEYRIPRSRHRSFHITYPKGNFQSRSGYLFWILNIPLIWLTVFTYLRYEIYPVGWFMAASALLIAYVINRKAVKNGSRATAIIFLFTVFAFLLILIHSEVFGLSGFSMLSK